MLFILETCVCYDMTLYITYIKTKHIKSLCHYKYQHIFMTVYNNTRYLSPYTIVFVQAIYW